MIFDPGGVERFRLGGYLPNAEFRAQLELGLARAAAPEAQYWTGLAYYNAANDHTAPGQTAGRFKTRYPESIWAKGALPWST